MGILDAFSGKKKMEAKKIGPKKTSSKKASDDVTTVATTKDAKEVAPAQDLKGEAYRVLIAPIYTEKTSAQQAYGQYSFFVAPDATKVDVARAVKDLYGVKPTSVRVINVLGKIVRRGRFTGQQKDVKKAVVSLKKGDSITLSI